MNLRFLPLLVCSVALSSSRAADEEPAHTNMKEALRARMIEDAKKAPARPPAKASAPAANSPAGSAAPSSSSPTATPASSSPSSPAPAAASPASADTSANTAAAPASAAPAASASSAATAATSPAAASAATTTGRAATTNAGKAATPGATVLPKMEVKKGRITVLDQQLAKQEEDIARERKNLKSSEADLALNDSKVAKPLAIFGGESAQFRKRVASERVELMEAEKDIIEAMARAKTKAEKDELQKQLDEIRTFRRELDKTLR